MANAYDLPAAIVCFLTSVSALEDTIQRLRKIVCFVFGNYCKMFNIRGIKMTSFKDFHMSQCMRISNNVAF